MKLVRESKVKDGNYICIQSFMVKELQLKGNELLVYAIIYGFSQEKNQWFNGSLQYIADWLNCTKQGVIKNLKSLIEKGFIIKNEKYFNGIKFCEYRSTEFNRVLNNVEQGIKQSLNNNIEDKKSNNIVNMFNQEFDELWELYPRKVGKAKAQQAYIKARKSGVDFDTIKQGVFNYSRYVENNKIEQEFIKHGSTWFNQQCWNDEYGGVKYSQGENYQFAGGNSKSTWGCSGEVGYDIEELMKIK